MLVDSGGHYLTGTTDVTRTVALGPLTDEEKSLYTAVLKGHLALANAKFRHGCTGRNLDYLARSREAAVYCAEKLGWYRVKCHDDDAMRTIADIHAEVMTLAEQFV